MLTYEQATAAQAIQGMVVSGKPTILEYKGFTVKVKSTKFTPDAQFGKYEVNLVVIDPTGDIAIEMIPNDSRYLFFKDSELATKSLAVPINKKYDYCTDFLCSILGIDTAEVNTDPLKIYDMLNGKPLEDIITYLYYRSYGMVSMAPTHHHINYQGRDMLNMWLAKDKWGRDPTVYGNNNGFSMVSNEESINGPRTTLSSPNSVLTVTVCEGWVGLMTGVYAGDYDNFKYRDMSDLIAQKLM